MNVICSQKRKKAGRQERSNDSYSVDKNGVVENGEERDIGKRGCNVSTKQVTVEKNGNSREARRTGYLSGKKGVVTRKRQERGLKNVSNGNGNKLGVKRNGSLRESRRRASNHAGKVLLNFNWYSIVILSFRVES